MHKKWRWLQILYGNYISMPMNLLTNEFIMTYLVIPYVQQISVAELGNIIMCACLLQ